MAYTQEQIDFAQAWVSASELKFTAILTAGLEALDREQRREGEGVGHLAEAAAFLTSAISEYAPSAGEDADEIVEVRLGDLWALRRALAPHSGPNNEAPAWGPEVFDRAEIKDGDKVIREASGTLTKAASLDTEAAAAKIENLLMSPVSGVSMSGRPGSIRALAERIAAALARDVQQDPEPDREPCWYCGGPGGDGPPHGAEHCQVCDADWPRQAGA